MSADRRPPLSAWGVLAFFGLWLLQEYGVVTGHAAYVGTIMLCIGAMARGEKEGA